MDLPAHVRRTDGRGGRRVVHRATAVIASMWQSPTRRHLGVPLAVAALAAIAFARIAEDYLTNDPLARWDVSFARWLSGERSTAGTDSFRAITFFGSPAVALAIATVACVVLYRRRQIAEAALVPVVLGGGELLNLILKLSFQRDRPEVAFVVLDTYSFPSGHAMISTAAYGLLAFLAWGRLRTRRSRLVLLAVTVAAVALIGFSRLYLGVHYLSDVLAGIAGGVFWLAASIAFAAVYGDRFASHFTGSKLDRLGRRVTRS